MEPISSPERIWERLTLVVISGLFVAVNTRWLWMFRHGQPLDIDEAGYLGMSLTDYFALTEHGVIGWLRAVAGSSVYAPVTPALSSLASLMLGPGTSAAFAVILLAGVVVIVASYYLGKVVGGRRTALLTSIVVATSPIIINYSRTYIFAMPATAVTSVALLALLRSDRFANVRWALLFGFCLGLMPLTRTMTLAFMPGLLLAAIAHLSAGDVDRRRVSILLVSGAVATMIGSTWLVPNFRPVLSYLITLGYDSRAAEYGPQYSLFSVAAWRVMVQVLAGYVYLPQLALISVGAMLLVFGGFELILQHGMIPAFRLIGASRLLPPVIFIVEGVVALTSTPVKGTAFIAPLVPVMLLMAVWALGRWNQSRKWQSVAAGLILCVALFSSTPLADLSVANARPWVVDLPMLGPTLVTDGRGPIHKYEARGGYSTSDPALPVAPATGQAWLDANTTTARKLTEAGQSQPGGVAFGLRGFLYNTNTVNLAQLQATKTQFVFAQIVPGVTADSVEAYVAWLRGEARTACVLLTATGTIGEIRPLVNQDHLESAARNEKFSQFDQWVLPDGRTVKMWRRGRGAFADVAPTGDESTQPHAVGAAFGSWATLEGYHYTKSTEGISLHLQWRAIGPLNPDVRVAVHLIDDKGNILAQDDYGRCGWISAGDTTDDVVDIPTSQFTSRVRAIAIGLYANNGTISLVPIDRGARDWDGHRLLLSLPDR